MNIVSLIRRAIAVCSMLALCACGGGGGGGGEGTPPATRAPSADLTGTWTVTETGVSNCPGEATFSVGPYQVNVTQSGNNLTVVTPAGTFSGTIDGDKAKWTGSYPEDGGTTTITSMTLTVSADDNHFSGSSTWSWSDGRNTCSGTTQAINGTRVPGTGPKPNPPTGLRGTPQSSSAILLQWTDAADNETGFKLERKKTTEASFGPARLLTKDTTSTTDTSLEPSTSYDYRLRAYNANGDSATANVVGVTTLPASAAIPIPPSGLALTVNSSASITVRWTDNSTNESSFRIERTTSTGVLTVINPAANTESYTDTGLSASTTYTYKVAAVNSAGMSAFTAPVSATTPAVASVAAPTNLIATALSSTSIRLNWADNSNNETGFNIERSTSASGVFTQIAVVAPGIVTYTDTGLTAETTYFYRVRASNISIPAFSNYSNTDSETTMTAAVPVLTGPASSSGTFTLTWTYIWGGIVSTGDGYELQESTTSATAGFTTIVSTVNMGDHASPKVSSLTRSAGTYHYRVRARKILAFSPWSNVVTVTVGATTARTLRIINDLENRTLSGIEWGKLNGIIRVRIGTTENAVITATALEKLWPSDSAPSTSDAFTYIIDPALNQTTSSWDFNVSAFSTTQYWVYIQTGWWDFFVSQFGSSWEKHTATVLGCAGQAVPKWATFSVTNHASGTFAVQASQFLPDGNFQGTSFCP